MKKYWFKAKRYGYGWYPSSWEGWTVMAVYTIALIAIFLRIDSQTHSVSDTIYGITIPILVITAILVFIAWLTGEKARWRWGN